LEQSVSGQFFQLLAGLGEKVIMESCRYEAMLTGVRHQAGEIENLVSQWEQYFAGSSPCPPEQGQKPTGTTVEFNWDAIVGQNSSKKQQIQEIQAVAGDFLNQNPDWPVTGTKSRWWFSVSKTISASTPKMPPSPSVKSWIGPALWPGSFSGCRGKRLKVSSPGDCRTGGRI
jgi:hypothetical protein